MASKPVSSSVSLRLPARSAELVEQAAALLGKPAEQEHYLRLAQEVGAGKHVWTYAYAGQPAPCRQLTLNSTMCKILDEGEALPLVMAAISKFSPELVDRIMAQEQHSLREAVSFLPKGGRIKWSVLDETTQ